MSRSYSTFREMKPFSDGWKEATYSAMAPSDHVHRPFMLETEGKKMPIIRYGSGSNGESYVIKAEVVETIGFAPEYRRQPWEEVRDYGAENRHRYRYPDQKLEEFIHKVPDEASRAPTKAVALPLTSAWRSGRNRPIAQENNRKNDDERNFERDDRKKLSDSPNTDRYSSPYLNNKGMNYTQPVIGTNRDAHEFYERPRGNEGPNARKSYPLINPTNEINKPSYGNGKEKEKEFNTSAKSDISRPVPKTFPLGMTRWRSTGTNMSAPDTKVEPQDRDSEEEEKSRNPLGKFDKLKITNSQGGADQKSLEKILDDYENSKANIAPAAVFEQTAGMKKTPEKIDSREASKGCGTLLSRAAEEKEHEGTITSEEAMAKYKGALLPSFQMMKTEDNPLTYLLD